MKTPRLVIITLALIYGSSASANLLEQIYIALGKSAKYYEVTQKTCNGKPMKINPGELVISSDQAVGLYAVETSENLSPSGELLKTCELSYFFEPKALGLSTVENTLKVDFELKQMEILSSCTEAGSTSPKIESEQMTGPTSVAKIETTEGQSKTGKLTISGRTSICREGELVITGTKK